MTKLQPIMLTLAATLALSACSGTKSFTTKLPDGSIRQVDVWWHEDPLMSQGGSSTAVCRAQGGCADTASSQASAEGIVPSAVSGMVGEIGGAALLRPSHINVSGTSGATASPQITNEAQAVAKAPSGKKSKW